MENFKRLFVAFFIFSALFSCEKSHNERLLESAEKYMDIAPQKSRADLEKIEINKKTSDYQKAKIYLLQTQADHKCHIPLKKDSAKITFSADYFTLKEEPHHAALSWLYKGLMHKQCKETEKAAEAFAKSELWFEEITDDRHRGLLHTNRALLSLENKEFANSLHHFLKSYSHYLNVDSVHYLASACANVARVYSLLGEKDSAAAYYKRGMAHKGKIPPRRYYTLLLNYANFLERFQQEHKEAEQMLLECERHIADTVYKEKVYSSLATLYCNTNAPHKAKEYAMRVVESRDPAVESVGYFLLYRIYKQLGDADTATLYHDRYRQIQSDLNMRLKDVNDISNQVKMEEMEEKNEEEKRSKVWWIIGSVILLSVGSVVYYMIYRRRMQAFKQKDLEQNLHIGHLKSDVKNKKKKINRLEKENEEKKNTIRELKSATRQLVEEMQEVEKEARKREKLQDKEKNDLLKSKKDMQEQLGRFQHVDMLDRLTELYSLKEGSYEIRSMLNQLRSGKRNEHNPVSASKYPALLREMLEEQYPDMADAIDALVKNQTKRVICYLLALGIDDMNILADACVSSIKTVRNYRKEMMGLVEELKGQR